MDPARRKIRSATDAAACLSAIAASGDSLPDWCRANAVDGRSLHVWRLAKLRREGRLPVRPRMVELVPEQQSPPSQLTLWNGGFSLDLPMGFDEELLESVVRVLRKC